MFRRGFLAVLGTFACALFVKSAPLPTPPKVLATMDFSPKFLVEKTEQVTKIIMQSFAATIRNKNIDVTDAKYKVVVSLIEVE